LTDKGFAQAAVLCNGFPGDDRLRNSGAPVKSGPGSEGDIFDGERKKIKI